VCDAHIPGLPTTNHDSRPGCARGAVPTVASGGQSVTSCSRDYSRQGRPAVDLRSRAPGMTGSAGQMPRQGRIMIEALDTDQLEELTRVYPQCH